MKLSSSTRKRPRNQRVSNPRQRKQQHLLDVKVRARKATQYRNRRVLVFISKIALAAAICAGIYFGARVGMRRFFFENPDYRLTMIDMQTDGTLQRDQVLKIAGLREGENIFQVNLAQVHRVLQQLPQVDEVEVLRKLPGEIDIRILERKPIAWITSEKQITDPFQSNVAFLMDARGVLMKEKKLLPEYLGLPLVTGCTSESLEPGKIVESVEAKAALELLRLSAGSFMQTRFQIREIDIRILERKPIAWITSEKQISDPFQSDVAFLIDARGVLMKEKKLLPEYLGLPLITGCTSESLEPGKIVQSIEAKAALELLRLSAGSFMQTRFQIREIDVSKGYCLVVTDKNHTRVTVGFDHGETNSAPRTVSRLCRRFPA